jgi:hypothetical protein
MASSIPASLSLTPAQLAPNGTVHVTGMGYPYGGTVTLTLTGMPGDVAYAQSATPSVDPSGQIAADLVLGGSAQYCLTASVSGQTLATLLFQV